MRFARAVRWRVGNVTYAVALALVADAVGRLHVLRVKLRTAKRNWNDLVQLIAPWVERREAIVYGPPAYGAW